MATANVIVLITFVTLALYSSNVKISVSATDCVLLPQNEICDIPWNVTNAQATGSDDKLRRINSTLDAVKEATLDKECLSGIQNLTCITEFPDCNSTNSTLEWSKRVRACMVIQKNCSELVKKTYAGGMLCPQIDGYNNSECVEVSVARGGYCQANETYKILAENIKGFLQKASKENAILNASNVTSENITQRCLTEYRKLNCKSFVGTCQQNTTYKGICEEKLTCLPQNSSIADRSLCSKFPVPTTPPTTPVPTTPYDFTSGFNTSLTIRLNAKFEKDYSNKSSSLYKSFAKDVAKRLTNAYNGIGAFRGVFIEELSCHEQVAVKHTVVTSSKTNVNLLEAKLTLANFTSGYLKGKVTEANKACVDGKTGNADDHLKSDNWVYMIVFVCITALLLLAMVCIWIQCYLDLPQDVGNTLYSDKV